MAVLSPNSSAGAYGACSSQRVRHMTDDPPSPSRLKFFISTNEALSSFGRLEKNLHSSMPENGKYRCWNCRECHFGTYEELLDHLNLCNCTPFRPRVIDGDDMNEQCLREAIEPYTRKPSKEMKEAIRKAWAEVVSETGVPFRFVESRALKKLLALIQPREGAYSTLPTRASISKAVDERQKEIVIELNRHMAGNNLTLALYEWKSISKTSILGLIYYLADGTPLLYNAEDISGNKKSEGTAIVSLIERHIRVDAENARVVAIVSDTASSFRSVKNGLAGKYSNLVLLPCFAHQMDLIAHDIHRRITWVKMMVDHSNRLSSFFQTASRLDMFNIFNDVPNARAIKLTPMVSTRWISIFHMLWPIAHSYNSIRNALRTVYSKSTGEERTEAEELLRFMNLDGYVDNLLTAHSMYSGLVKLQDRLQQNSARLREVLPIIHQTYLTIVNQCRKGKVLDQENQWQEGEFCEPDVEVELEGLIMASEKRISQFWDLELLTVAAFLDPKCDKSIFSDFVTEEFVKSAIDALYRKFFNEQLSLRREYDLFRLDNRYSGLEFERTMQPINSTSHVAFWGRHMSGPSIPHLAKLADHLEKVAINTAGVERMFSNMNYLWNFRRNRIDYKKVLSMVQQQVLFRWHNPSSPCFLDLDGTSNDVFSPSFPDETGQFDTTITTTGASPNGAGLRCPSDSDMSEDDLGREASWHILNESCPNTTDYLITQILADLRMTC